MTWQPQKSPLPEKLVQYSILRKTSSLWLFGPTQERPGVGALDTDRAACLQTPKACLNLNSGQGGCELWQGLAPHKGTGVCAGGGGWQGAGSGSLKG